jgi:hypothetical protein
MSKRVHCHICPMKEICPDTIGHSKTSWRIERSKQIGHHIAKKDLDLMAESTRLCPLLAVLAVAYPDFNLPYENKKGV